MARTPLAIQALDSDTVRVQKGTHMRVLIIGGTRNLGPSIITALLRDGHQVTIFHRGRTLYDLPREIEVLRGDRSEHADCQHLLGSRDFDAAIDTTLYNGSDAAIAIDVLRGHVGHYLFISTGQVYLVREGPQRPFREEDYEGSVMPEPPKENHLDHDNWVYGVEKRAAEDLLAAAYAKNGFPFTSLRLPMVNSERDHYHRLQNYLLRMWDGGPLLVPGDPGLPLRHIYGEDVVRAIQLGLTNPKTIGRTYNISQNETLSLRDFLGLTAEIAGSKLHVAAFPRPLLDSARLLPSCSPFSDPWMSSLTNDRSQRELGMTFTPVRDYLQNLIEHYREHREPSPPGYEQRNRELAFAQHHGA
jgi:nucleoside-diphosphate-sugar epimerase